MCNQHSNYYLNALLNSNERIVLEIYQRFYPKTEAFILQNQGTDEDAKDVFQKVLFQITARVKVQSIEIKSNFEAYLYVACKNQWRNELNRRKRNRIMDEEYSYELINDNIEDTSKSVDQERWELMDEKIAKMPPTSREILNSYLKHNDYDTLIAKFGYTNRNTAFQRVFKSKKYLKELIVNDYRFNRLAQLSV